MALEFRIAITVVADSLQSIDFKRTMIRTNYIELMHFSSEVQLMQCRQHVAMGVSRS